MYNYKYKKLILPNFLLTVLHTGKRWFIICPVPETPFLDDEKPTSKSSTAQSMFHVDILDCANILFTLCSTVH